jgi:hypothetical protein
MLTIPLSAAAIVFDDRYLNPCASWSKVRFWGIKVLSSIQITKEWH